MLLKGWIFRAFKMENVIDEMLQVNLLRTPVVPPFQNDLIHRDTLQGSWEWTKRLTLSLREECGKYESMDIFVG